LRANEYDLIYDFEPWKDDLAYQRKFFPQVFSGLNVYEVACGTGYWTQIISRTASEILAIDYNETTLTIARDRSYHCPTELIQHDAYFALPDRKLMSAGFASGWLSHVDLNRIHDFFRTFHSMLAPESLVLLSDERDHAKRIKPASRTDSAGNRYEQRKLKSGRQFEIIKNFYMENDFRELLKDVAIDLEYRQLENFWMLIYRTKA